MKRLTAYEACVIAKVYNKILNTDQAYDLIEQAAHHGKYVVKVYGITPECKEALLKDGYNIDESIEKDTRISWMYKAI
jgi:hypothetical protein